MQIRKTTVLYFSPTGGTKKVAQLLAQALSAEEADITVSVPEQARRFGADELVVLCVPVYGGRVPLPFCDRVRELAGEQTLLAPVAVYGNRAVDDALLETQLLANRQGFVTVAAASFIAPHSIDTQYGAGRPNADDVAPRPPPRKAPGRRRSPRPAISRCGSIRGCRSSLWCR